MRKYDTYKPTKIEFLDVIPQHWEEKRMRFYGYLYGGLSGKNALDFNQLTNEENKFFIPFTNIASNFRIDPESLQTVVISENENQNKVLKGDLFFLMSSENYDDVGKTAVLIDDLEETYLNSFCKGFRIIKEKIVPEFLNYQLHSKQLRHNLLTGANGFTRINLKIDKVIDLLTAIPTPEEQIAIADYLDRKTAEIDELIADKKRLIELYEEEKTAIINQAVTKGINPQVPMKNSGIEWLGEIPEHWRITRINRVIKVKDGTHETPNYLPISDYNYPLVTSKDFKKGEIDFENSKYISEEDHEKIVKRSNTEKGDIIMSMIGGNIGNLVLVNTERPFSIKNVCLFKTSHNEIIAKHLYYILKSDLLNIQISLNSRGGAQGFLSLDDLRSLVYFVLPMDEIQSIVYHIETECSLIDAKKAKTEKLIELLTEYRIALISEVVTGKIKVIE
jgi:type I restriction enzyme S subunit